MVTTNNDGIRTFIAGADLVKGRRVKISTSDLTVSYAGLNEDHDGVTLGNADSGYPVQVALRNKPGTVGICCASTCTIGASLYSAANGKVDDVSTSAGNRCYRALEACNDADAVIECLPIPQIVV